MLQVEKVDSIVFYSSIYLRNIRETLISRETRSNMARGIYINLSDARLAARHSDRKADAVRLIQVFKKLGLGTENIKGNRWIVRYDSHDCLGDGKLVDGC